MFIASYSDQFGATIITRVFSTQDDAAYHILQEVLSEEELRQIDLDDVWDKLELVADNNPYFSYSVDALVDVRGYVVAYTYKNTLYVIPTIFSDSESAYQTISKMALSREPDFSYIVTEVRS